MMYGVKRCCTIVTVGRTVEHLKKEMQQKGDIGLVAEVSTIDHVVCDSLLNMLSQKVWIPVMF